MTADRGGTCFLTLVDWKTADHGVTWFVELLVPAGPRTAVALDLFILADCGTADRVAANLTLLKWPGIVKFSLDLFFLVNKPQTESVEVNTTRTNWLKFNIGKWKTARRSYWKFGCACPSTTMQHTCWWSLELSLFRRLVSSFVIASSAEQSIISKLHFSNCIQLDLRKTTQQHESLANWSSIILVNGAMIIKLKVAPVFSQLFSRENA